MGKVNVTISLSDITVTVEELEGMSNKELLEVAKQEVINQLGKKFPHFTYSLSSPDSLSFDNVKTGMLVENEKYGTGVVLKVNSKTINVAFKTGVLSDHPTAFKKSNVKGKKINKLVWGKRSTHFWYEGDSGFLINKGELVPVVIGKSTKNFTEAIIIGSEGKYYKLSESQLEKLLVSSEKEYKEKETLTK